jgi:phospholipase C
MKKTPYRFLLQTQVFVLFLIITSASLFAQPNSAEHQSVEKLRKKVQHIIVIYQENWSFDGLFGKFPDCENLEKAGNIVQLSKTGQVLAILPQPIIKVDNINMADKRFPEKMPVEPYDLSHFVGQGEKTGDLVHRFYTQQLQIDKGKMDKFVAWSDNGGLVLSNYDGSNLPEGKLAREFTLCDHFFQSAFGGSFLNHMWLIAAASPTWEKAPKILISQPDPDKPGYNDNQVTPDHYVVNTAYSVNHPHPANLKDTVLVPNIDMPNIGDRLNDKKISWAYYSGGWNDALAGHPDPTFQFHHQPFVYFSKYKDGSNLKKEHLKDENDFITELIKGNLPSVSFIKTLGKYNEHPGYASVEAGQMHVDSLVKLIQKSKYWDDCVIIITYDENGGRWDHVAPPIIDRWGPGTRVPAIIISPFAKKGFVDHTPYETVSILKLIETRFGLKPLTKRDAQASGLMNAFDF